MADSRLGAAIDVGSTSVHLLVARDADGRVETLRDESRVVGLGGLVAADGRLGWTGIATILDALGELRDRSAGAPLTVVATDPLRRAPDAALAIRAVEDRLGLALHVVTPREEGLLAWTGAIGGRPTGDETVLVDVGGGSTEVVVGRRGRAPSVTALGVGAGRVDDERLRAALRLAPDARPAELVAVGGTADNLLKVVGPAAPDGILRRDAIVDTLDRLADEAAEAVAARHGLRTARVRRLAPGGAILLALLDRYGLASLRVSPAGLREGVVIVAAAHGRGWRDALERAATGG